MDERQFRQVTVRVRPLSDHDGGGWLAEVEEMQGCIADGETVSDALRDIADAITEWLEARTTWVAEGKPFEGRPDKDDLL